MDTLYDYDLKYTDREHGDIHLIVYKGEIEVYAIDAGLEEFAGHLKDRSVKFVERAVGAIEREIKRVPISLAAKSWLTALDDCGLLGIWRSKDVRR